MFGAPDMDHTSTAYIERNNGTMRHHIDRMRRLCYAFSKKIEHHRAAIALCYAHYNFCHIVKTLRVTPAMAAGVTDHVWELGEFMDAVLADVASEKPVPHAHLVPAVTARELPGGRGWLQVVGSKRGPAPTSLGPAPAAPRVHVTVPISSGPMGQMDLMAWKRPPVEPSPAVKPRPAVQLDLFGIEIDPEHDK